MCFVELVNQLNREEHQNEKIIIDWRYGCVFIWVCCTTTKKESLSEKWAKQDELALKGEITDKTDKFTGEREIKWQVSGIVDSQYTQTIVPEKFSVIKGKKQYNELLITKKGRSPVKCDETHWLVDGKKFNLKPYNSGLTAARDFYLQLNIYRPTNAQLKQLANANQIDIKICNNEYSFTQNEINGLKELVKAAGL